MLPDMSTLIRQKLVENAKTKKLKCDILSNFHTMCPESPTEVLLHFRLGVQGYFKLQSLFACAKFVVYFVMCPKLVFVKATVEF